MSRSTRLMIAGLFVGPSFASMHMAEANGGRGGGRPTTAPPDFANVPGLTWEEFDVKTAITEGPDKGKSRVVGTVKAPNFDEDNLDAGIKQMSQFDWPKATAGRFPDFKTAIVKMVNTQFGTHLRNWKRQEANPRMNAQQLELEALDRETKSPGGAQRMADKLKEGMAAFMAYKTKLIDDLRAEYAAKRGQGQVVATDATTTADEADAEAAVTGSVSQ